MTYSYLTPEQDTISEEMFKITVMFRIPYQAHAYYKPRQSLFPYVITVIPGKA